VEWNKELIETRRIAIPAPQGDLTGMAGFRREAEVAESKLSSIEKDVAAVRGDVDMSAETAGLRAGWRELQAKVVALPADADFASGAFAAHAPEFSRIYAFLRDLGNKSGLSEDPETDLSYLGYTLANNTPSTAGITVRIAAYAAMNLSRGEISAKDKLFYELTDARLGDTFGAVETLLSQSMNANPAVDRALSGRFQTLKERSKTLLAFVRTNFTSVDKPAATADELARAVAPTVEAAWALVDANMNVLAQLLDERGAKAKYQRDALALVVLLGVLSSAYLYVGVYLSIAAGLADASRAARAMSDCQLGTVSDARSRDEFADLLKDMRDADRSLATVIASVKSASDSIATAAREIADGTQDLSNRTEESASTLQDTASSMHELTGTVQQSSRAASTAIETASSTAATAQRGGAVVSQVVHKMSEIEGSSKRIGDIIGVIDGIAFQTNILALNAAVEAARAGEQGRGFAVVATEVRSLAKRSADAAREIKSLIEASLGTVESGARLVDEAGTTMTEIMASVERVTGIIGAITTSAEEQGRGIVHVNGAVSTLDRMTQQNAALVEQSAAAAESLKAQAGALAGLVSRFRIH
jgi:methyl-accepting chemotaxis protein